MKRSQENEISAKQQELALSFIHPRFFQKLASVLKRSKENSAFHSVEESNQTVDKKKHSEAPNEFGCALVQCSVECDEYAN